MFGTDNLYTHERSTLLPAHRPVSVETMLSAIRDSLHKAVRDDFKDEDPDGDAYRMDLARANSVRLARLDCFAALCVGGAGRTALTPGRALALVRDALDAAHTKWEEAMERHFDDGDLDGLAEDETVEACLAALVRTALTSGGGGDRDAALLRFEADLAGELRAREADFPGAYANTFDDAPRTAHKKERTRKCVEQILEALRAQIATLAPSQPLSAPAVVPLALSDADFMPGALFGVGSTDYYGNLRTWFKNDHEGHITYVCVAEAWVALVCMKVGSC